MIDNDVEKLQGILGFPQETRRIAGSNSVVRRMSGRTRPESRSQNSRCSPQARQSPQCRADVETRAPACRPVQFRKSGARFAPPYYFVVVPSPARQLAMLTGNKRGLPASSSRETNHYGNGGELFCPHVTCTARPELQIVRGKNSKIGRRKKRDQDQASRESDVVSRQHRAKPWPINSKRSLSEATNGGASETSRVEEGDSTAGTMVLATLPVRPGIAA